MGISDRIITVADLKDAATAIAFAMTRLEMWEVPMFLKDWRDGADLAPWLQDAEEWMQIAA